MDLKNKKIAFVIYQYPLNVSTMIINSVQLLSVENEVSVLVDNDQQVGDLFCENPNVKFIKFDQNPILSFLYRIINFFGRKSIKYLKIRNKKFGWWIQNLFIYEISYLLKKISRNINFDIIIPVEAISLIISHLAVKDTVSLIYYDMELLDWSKDSPIYENKEYLKILQSKALSSAAYVMITSPNRAKLFSEINNFPEHLISVLPVVPCRKKQVDRSNYFREKFKIDKEKKIVLYAGNFMPWAQCVEIIQSVSSWPENSVLVMHTWNKNSLSSDYFKRMKEYARGKKIYFSSELIPYDVLTQAFSSVDIGLLFYQSLDSNFTEIVFSSNKMGEYVSAGLPLICSPLGSLKEFVEKNEIGICCSFENLGEAVNSIILNYKFYSGNVLKCREESFVFEKYFYDAFNSYSQRDNDTH